ncbi:gas vesicle protein [Kitasatospora purpeofusca]|uniref:gas vesicle protein GvpO n=1 Tax=Kitasatospora purpeofusca TaxID=67352 RepID=UPI002A5AFD48|nr:gas vesicle protein [Kitasatospora purpeofusca]MDY0812770.1 gas vesicle protein [Kitasatospora purpeofusca]
MAPEKREDGVRERRPAHADPPSARTGSTGRRAAGEAGAAGAARRRSRRVSAPQAMSYAAEQLAQLLGRVPESVSALKPTEDGWRADVEVVELERIPETTSVMASYRVSLDEEGELVAYERIRRYTRGQIDPRP